MIAVQDGLHSSGRRRSACFVPIPPDDHVLALDASVESTYAPIPQWLDTLTQEQQGNVPCVAARLR